MILTGLDIKKCFHTGAFLCVQNCNAPITVKPEGRGGSGNPREFDCHVYPQGRDFDRISRPKGGEFWHGRHLG